MKTYRKYFPSTMFSGEVILSDVSYDTFEEAKANTDAVYDSVDWEEYNEKGRFIRSSYGKSCYWM